MKNKFRTARQLKKIKVIEATELLGISQPTLSAWETGNKAPLTFPKENKIKNTFPPKCHLPPTSTNPLTTIHCKHLQVVTL